MKNLIRERERRVTVPEVQPRPVLETAQHGKCMVVVAAEQVVMAVVVVGRGGGASWAWQ